MNRKTITTVDELVDEGLISSEQKSDYDRLKKKYDIAITPHIRKLITDKNDPVGKQYIPDVKELDTLQDEQSDPIGDKKHEPVKGIVHRYPDRVLFKVVNICAVYCRYCFRREMIGQGSDPLRDEDFDAAITYIKSHPEIWEVILTGGDPLVLSSRRLQKIIDAINQIDHVKVLRVHTRVPVAKPDQITETIISVLKSSSKAMQVVLHVNHIGELTHEVEQKIMTLRDAGCMVLSQSVLLKDVNDDAKILEQLFRKLVLLHVRPYYIHHPDRAKGTSHFRVSLKRGRELMKELHANVSGICLPKYMLDIPGGYGKIPVCGGDVRTDDNELYTIEDHHGNVHLYNDRVSEEDQA